MSVKFEEKKFTEWLEMAMFAQTTFFRVRKSLYAKLLKTTSKTGSIELPASSFQLMKGFLLARNQDLSDAKTLAFETLIAELYEAQEVPPSAGDTGEEEKPAESV
jgi:hypothetical protein